MCSIKLIYQVYEKPFPSQELAVTTALKKQVGFLELKENSVPESTQAKDEGETKEKLAFSVLGSKSLRKSNGSQRV